MVDVFAKEKYWSYSNYGKRFKISFAHFNTLREILLREMGLNGNSTPEEVETIRQRIRDLK
ncbi:MAG: hypothetical protein V1977_01130 [Candidatus Diapherotrites archaeon]